MRAGIVSLCLLAAAARGCSLRGSAPGGDLALLEQETNRGLFGLFEAPKETKPKDAVSSLQPSVVSAFSKRREGKRALRAACGGDQHFVACRTKQVQQGMASALELEECLSHAPSLSNKCSTGFKQW